MVVRALLFSLESLSSFWYISSRCWNADWWIECCLTRLLWFDDSSGSQSTLWGLRDAKSIHRSISQLNRRTRWNHPALAISPCNPYMKSFNFSTCTPRHATVSVCLNARQCVGLFIMNLCISFETHKICHKLLHHLFRFGFGSARTRSRRRPFPANFAFNPSIFLVLVVIHVLCICI